LSALSLPNDEAEWEIELGRGDDGGDPGRE
jgi:hypothetical protein